jgi:NhaP-type Na+/H+ or K+/H+ antiporter
LESELTAMEDPRILVAAAAILIYALLSRQLDRWWFSMPVVMVLIGLAVGADGLGWIGMDLRSGTVKTIAEVTLALMLFHDAVRIDLRALRSGFSLPLRLLAIGLPLIIAIGTLVAWGMMPAIGLTGALLVGAMLAPTDAALGAAVVTDQRLPVRVRQGLNVESGLNDGLSVPVFLVALALAANPNGWHAGALGAELLRQVGFGALGGLLVGGVGGLAFRAATRMRLVHDYWRRIAVLAIALGCFVCGAALGGSGFIGAFLGGVVFGLVSDARSTSDNALTGYLGSVFDALSFLVVGAMLLPFALSQITWTATAYAVLSLLAIRTACVALAMIGSAARWQTVAFIGWFGPRGLATVVFTVLLVDAGVPNGNLVATVAILGVVLSVFAHGFTAPPLVAAYARWWESLSAAPGELMEAKAVAEHPVRHGVSRGSDGLAP